MNELNKMTKKSIKKLLIDRINQYGRTKKELIDIVELLYFNAMFPFDKLPKNASLNNQINPNNNIKILPKSAYDPKCLTCKFYCHAQGIAIWCDKLGVDFPMPTKACKKYRKQKAKK